ncbi:SMC-Scp complex subunit ScpB [Mycoplasmoides alvi]|uniref:SMC-Scp complex subunit ScpB n=1 Tax=Mycoplasmoides alvi TaxID=78580 RepID=UPI000A04717E|nr:SMC-Scp complex subunit ScpB [Mycoplasmoides alvi]
MKKKVKNFEKNKFQKKNKNNNPVLKEDLSNKTIFEKEKKFFLEKKKANLPKKRSHLEEFKLDIKAIIHGALFVAGKEGMNLAELHKILPKLTMDEIRNHVLLIQQKMDKDLDTGTCIKEYGNKFKLLTKPDIKNEMQKYANLKFKNPLNSKLMEVLAIIAYNQPCTRPRISEIRGSDSAPLVDILINHGLVQELGRADTWGRPFIYSVTDKFFDLFGISTIEDLPKIQEFDIESFSEGNFFDSNRFEE